jgi:hypothetical protein
VPGRDVFYSRPTFPEGVRDPVERVPTMRAVGLSDLLWLSATHWDHEPKGQESRASVLECARCCAAFCVHPPSQNASDASWGALQDLSAVRLAFGARPQNTFWFARTQRSALLAAVDGTAPKTTEPTTVPAHPEGVLPKPSKRYVARLCQLQQRPKLQGDAYLRRTSCAEGRCCGSQSRAPSTLGALGQHALKMRPPWYRRARQILVPRLPFYP